MPRSSRRVTRLALAAAATSLVFPLTPATAADLSWSAPTSGRWLDPANWSTGTTPTSADTVTISTPGSYTVTVDGPAQAGPLTLDATDATLSVYNTVPFSFSATTFTVSAGTLSVRSPGAQLPLQSTSLTNAGTIDLDADSVHNDNPVVTFSTGLGAVLNSGTIEAHAAPAPSLPAVYYFSGAFNTPAFTNTGALRTVGASTLVLDHYTLNQNAGSLDGNIQFFSGTLNYNGGSCSPTVPTTLWNSTLKIAPTATAGNFSLAGSSYGSSHIATDIPAGNTVSTWADSSATWTGAGSTLTNAGRLFIGSYPSGTSPTTVSPSFSLGSSTLLNTGTLELNSPNLPAASFTGSITNQGVLAIHAPNGPLPTKVSGSFTQNPGGSLTIDPATSLSLSSPNTYPTVGFYFNGGTVTGPVSLNNVTTHFAPGLANTGAGVFTFTPSYTNTASPFTGDIPSGATFVHVCPFNAVTYYFHSFTNAGALRTSSTGNNRPVYQLDNYSGTLTNTGSIGGTVNGVDRGAHLEIDGNLVNTGTIKAYFLTVTGSSFVTPAHSFDQNAGTLDVDSTCTIVRATFNYNGGTLTGKPVGIYNSTLNIAPNTNPASFIFYYGDNTLHGSPAPGSVLSLDDLTPATATISVTADPFTNAGTLSLAATLGPVNSTLTLPNSGTLTNTGTLSVTLGHGGTRTINANILNTGTLSIGPGATLTLAGSLSTTAPLDLQGTLDLRGPLTWSYTTTSPDDTLRSLLLATHLTDSAADSSHRLAYADTGSAVTVTLALTGDANLDGQIDADDYALLDRAYARSLSDAHWTDGDFNYDGAITPDDYLLIDTTLGQSQGLSPALLSTRESQFGPAYVSALLAAVPEPSSLASLLLLLPLTRRRRT